MVSARSAAMTFNRLLDADIDARNRRTAYASFARRIVVFPLRLGLYLCLRVGFCLWSARQLGPLCFALSPLALAIIFFYSFSKRFTLFSHLILGLCLGIAPSAAWIAIRGSLDPRILCLTAAVMFWVAGFDVIYACQDFEFDVAAGLFSIPRRIGIARSLLVARLLHAAMIASLLALVFSFHLGPLSLAGVVAVIVLLVTSTAWSSPTTFRA